MQVLRAINAAVVDMYHLVFAPYVRGQDPDSVSDLPFWARALVGWGIIAAIMAGLVLFQ